MTPEEYYKLTGDWHPLSKPDLELLVRKGVITDHLTPDDNDIIGDALPDYGGMHGKMPGFSPISD
jgi:hypothetical protein